MDNEFLQYESGAKAASKKRMAQMIVVEYVCVTDTLEEKGPLGQV